MTAKLEIVNRSLRAAFIAACVGFPALLASAQTAITVLPSVNVRSSSSAASPSTPVTYGSAPLVLSCPASITAVVSSTPNGLGKVVVDDYLDLTVSEGTSAPEGPFDICGVTHPGALPTACFTPAYQKERVIGNDPDSKAATWGVGPLDIHGHLAPGINHVTLTANDIGSVLSSSSIYLFTNCTSEGVSGGGQISGNPIPATNPPASTLTQNFNFSLSDDHLIKQVLDFSIADQQKTITIPDGAIPTVTDHVIDPTDFPALVANTSFATSQCLVHFGELLPSGQAGCKLYTVTCQIGSESTGTGAQCPSSTMRNIVIEDAFDGPQFTLPDIHAGRATFHQGFGYLMANEGWSGGPCTFDPNSDQIYSCPENLLTAFTGPGATTAHSNTNHYNSTFISVGPVPEYATVVNFDFPKDQSWINRRTVNATFLARPPIVPAPNNGFVAAPLSGITYGVSLESELPPTTFPIPTDITVGVPGGCPEPGTPAEIFQTPPQTITVPSDGEYFVHYFATDCAGTEELFFYQDQSASWQTKFYTARLDVDTVAPEIISGPELSPAPTLIHGELGYHVGQQVTATYQCADGLSGVAKCGTKSYSSPTKNPPPAQTLVSTSTKGTHTFKVHVLDAAQNQGASASVDYSVFP